MSSEFDNIWFEESPVSLVEGSEPTYRANFRNATTITETGATMEVYMNGSGDDLSSTLTTGSITSDSVSTLYLKKLQSLVGGNVYVIALKVTVDGVVERRKLKIFVQKAKDL